MNLKETGKLIAKYRKEAGYTQQKLADVLHVTDKAVSKWERGICVPDTVLLPKLSRLLDADMEFLISANSDFHEHKWEGLLIIPKNGISLDTNVYDKPIIDYLISYFMLAGIKKINIICEENERKYIENRHFEHYGLCVKFGNDTDNPKMILYGFYFMFGVNLTRSLQNAMSVDDLLIVVIDNQELPLLFSPYGDISIEGLISQAEKKTLGRGMLAIPMDSKENIADVSEFVGIYQKYHKRKIADLHEIAVNRGMI